MMALPIELADDGDMVPVSADGPRPTVLDPDESLTETTYANFLCLVRALFPARAAHRLVPYSLFNIIELDTYDFFEVSLG